MPLQPDDKLLADYIADFHPNSDLKDKDMIERIVMEVGDKLVDDWTNKIMTYSQHGPPLTSTQMYMKLCSAYKLNISHIILPYVYSKYGLGALMALIEFRTGKSNEELMVE